MHPAQALNKDSGASVQHLREGAWASLKDFMSPEMAEGAARCADKLLAMLPNKDALEQNRVLVAYGGGKDSSYMLAFVRCIQLMLYRSLGATFRMRVVTNRHAGMPRAVMENIHRAYTALKLMEDPDCEPLLTDGSEVKPFRVDEPLPEAVVLRNRDDILMTGHRTRGDARPTFCNACNISMVGSFGLAAAYANGVDIIVTGDSRTEQRAYYVWVNRLAQHVGVRQPSADDRRGFKGFLETMDGIAGAYFSDIHGEEQSEAIRERRIDSRVPSALRFFSIYDDTSYSSGSHWEMLTGLLGFQFDDIAFSFTESDCGNPGLMAHLRGLKCERFYGRSYTEGIGEYVEFAVSLMRKKQFPELLIDLVRKRYEGAEGVARWRGAMENFAADSYGLDARQMVCMLYAPFTGGGQGLEHYLSREQPHLAGRAAEIHALLAGREEKPEPDSPRHGLLQELEKLSGLRLEQLRFLYSRPLHLTGSASAGSEGLIGKILERDPHQDVIQTRHTPEGPLVAERISGR